MASTGRIIETLSQIISHIKESLGTDQVDIFESIENSLRELDYQWNKVKELSEELENDIKEYREELEKMGLLDKLLSLSREVEKLLEKFRHLIEEYCPGLDVAPLLENRDSLNNFKKSMIDIEDEVDRLYAYVSNIRREVRKSIEKISESFEGRKSTQTEKILRSLIDKLENLEGLIRDLLKVNRILVDQLTDAGQYRGGGHSVALEIARILREILRAKGLWVHDMISKLTGLRSLAGISSAEEVDFEIEGYTRGSEEGGESRLPLDDFLARYPPFEPIHVEVDGVFGSNVWFIKAKNVTFRDHKLNRIISEEKVLYGKVQEGGGWLRLTKIRPVNLRRVHDNNIFIEIRVPIGKTTKRVFVKYGSGRLFRELEKKSIDVVQEDYRKLITKSKAGDKAYRVNDLGYVWYCKLGLALSTDPYDFRNCPFENDCHIGRTLRSKGDRCPNWHYSRRLFPKVYVKAERSLPRLPRSSSEHQDAATPFIPVSVREATIVERFTSAQWFMPSPVAYGALVEVEFEKPIIRKLTRTNVVGFKLPRGLVEAALSELISEEVKPKPSVRLSVTGDKIKEIGLDKLLISKFAFYRLTDGGRRQLSLLEMKTESIIKTFEKFYNELRSNEKLKKELIKYLTNVFAHTLAHLLYAFVSSELEIESQDLIYVYGVQDDYIVVLVAENSPHGAIDLPGHVEARFGSVEKLVQEFLEKALWHLDGHEKDLMNAFKGGAASAKYPDKQDLRKVAKAIRVRYSQLIQHGVVMDLPTFAYHLQLNDESQSEKIANEIGLSQDEVQELLERFLENIVYEDMGFVQCIDGCTMCVMLDRGCTEPLIQNLLLSRNLTRWLLSVLTGKEKLYGRGRSLLEPLLSLAERELVVLSPYVDDDGARILEEAARRGVKVRLVTRADTIQMLGDRYKGLIEVRQLDQPRHDKCIIIDESLVVYTTQNFTGLDSINWFELKANRADAAALKKELIGS
ncbi:phospholipase D-like domain-containing protein [Infirmifilum uzonense]|nr:phospholipase D-like domain-containing protein [Infirmifilum uzonense]